MKIYLESLGCARNQVDSEIMLGRLHTAGFVIVENPKEADTIIVNTCGFVESAINESIDTILEISKYKKTGSCRRLVVAGCLPERYKQDIAGTLPEVDVFLGTGAFDQIIESIADLQRPFKCSFPDPDSITMQGPDILRIRETPFMAYVKIAEGCSCRCTYCVIPKLRGKQKSRLPRDITSEVRSLILSGVKEVVLVAQDTTAYGRDLNISTDFADLLDQLSALSSEIKNLPKRESFSNGFRIRFLYGHPESIEDSVIGVVAKHPDLCPYFDLPIQHVSDPVLKKMGRRYTRDDLKRLMEKIRSNVPDAVIRTTVITGFPGETDEYFKELEDFIRKTRFDHLGAFIYSDSEDLSSHGLPDHVPEEIAKARLDIIMSEQRIISSKNIRKYRERILRVLVEERLEADLLSGRTDFQAPEVDGMTYIRSGNLQPGYFADIRITDTLEYDLVGEAL